MPDFDVFASTLLEEAKRFLERGVEAGGGGGEAPNLHAGLMLAFCALEAHVNAVADEMSQRNNQSPEPEVLAHHLTEAGLAEAAIPL